MTQVAVSAIVGTYLEKKRIHEENRLQDNSIHCHSSKASTQDAVLHNLLMDD